MTLQELHDDIVTALDYGADPDNEVRIVLGEPSVGARASCGIKWVDTGFDWESGRFNITPDASLCRRGRSKEDALRMVADKYVYDKRVTVIYHCPTCEEKLPKNARYCHICGQKVFVEPGYISVEKDYRTNKF